MKLTIEKVIVGGQGLARIPTEVERLGGMRAFVPYTLPGEIVEAEVREERRGYCTAEVQNIERASEFRTPPPCPWFGSCGGCQLQHSTHANQLQIKSAMLAEALNRAGLRDLPLISMLAGEPLGYRNRVRLHVQTRPSFAIGYRAAKSHRMTAIDRCPIAAPLLQRCISIADTLGQQGSVPAELLEIEFFTNRDQSEVLATCWVRAEGKFEAKPWLDFLGKMQAEVPQIAGVAIFAEEKSKHHTSRPLLQWDHKRLRYRVADRDYTVSQGSFFQVNWTIVDAFIDAATRCESGTLAWDLYAGVGLFSLPLAEKFAHVVAVESSPSACKDFRVNLHGKNATLVNSAVVDFLRRAVAQPQPAPDLALLDPPRAGLGVEECGLLARCGPRRIVYVSCDPATLGRDLAALIQSGYRLQQLQLVDMFPQTHHLETIATLVR